MPEAGIEIRVETESILSMNKRILSFEAKEIYFLPSQKSADGSLLKLQLSLFSNTYTMSNAHSATSKTTILALSICVAFLHVYSVSLRASMVLC